MKHRVENFDVIVIGGGASGMMAAAVAAGRGKRVCILEKNNALGEKLKISGGGRCNITNAQPDRHLLLKSYGRAEPHLHSPFSQFGVRDTFTFFESRSLPLVVEERNRAFPQTQKALDVFNVLKAELDRTGVVCKTNTPVKRIAKQGDEVTGVETAQGACTAQSYILATGGMSHPETGSTGDGFGWLTELGHTVKAPSPSIVPLAVADKWVKLLSGVSLPHAKITFYLEEQKQFSKTGNLLFTHFGLSGPAILNSSTKVGELLESGPVHALIDAYPQTDLGALEKNIIAVFDANKNKALKTILKFVVPPGMTPAIELLLRDVDFETRVHSITKDDRKKLVRLLKALPVNITNLMGFDRAVVADGGVVLEQIDMRTMRSKLMNNLYVTGDLLNINRPSGGFSLQLCWTTGYVAGSAV